MIGFWKIKDAYGQFSNWYPAEFDFEGKHFFNSEQAFMYKKAELFHDEDVMHKILQSKNPMTVKKLGRTVKPFNAEIFDKHKYEFMKSVVYEKFNQNEDLKALLLGTGSEILAEASPLDRIWGIGLSVDDERFCDVASWKGENLLGKVLMEVRGILIKQ